MAWLSFASLSISKFIDNVGSAVGFASLIGLAVLVVLYFAGARETKTLRDQLEDAHNRIQGLEVRLSQVLRGQVNRPQAAGQTTQPPAVTPAPALRPMGSAVAQVRRDAPPTQATSVGGAQPAVGTGAALAGATAGVGAPALGSATTLIPVSVPSRSAAPVPSAVPSGAPGPAPTVSVGATTALAVAGSGSRTATLDDVDYDPDDTMYVAGPDNGGIGTNGGGLPPVTPPPATRPTTAPPRVQIRGEEPDDFGQMPPRRTIPTAPPSRPSAPRRFAGRLVPMLIGVGAIVVIIVVLLIVTQSGKTAKPVHVASTPTHTTPAKKKAPAFDPASVKVAVLNGTGLAGVAGDVGRLLTKAGYSVPAAAITNDQVTDVATSSVQYRSGYSAQAKHVAASLAKSTGSAIVPTSPATSESITACGTPSSSSASAQGSCPANVIVIVGTDLSSVSAASGGGA